MLFLLVTSFVVPESSGLSSPVRDSRESTEMMVLQLMQRLEKLVVSTMVPMRVIATFVFNL